MKYYLVGGAVRDKLLGIKVRDKDWLVVGGTYQKMVNLGFKPVGNCFPVFIHPKTNEEYALARTEKKKGKGHNNFICSFSKKISLKEDLYRRDLTINAIALDEKGNYYDPYNGILDIKNRVIKHVSFCFLDDPLRVLRVAQLYCRLFKYNFNIYPKTLDLMLKISISGELLYLSSERIWKETEKALRSSNPELYFFVLYKCKALNILFPEFIKLFNNKKIFNFFSLVLQKSVFLNFSLKIRFILLCLFLKKTILSNSFLSNFNKFIFCIKLFCKRISVPKLYLKYCCIFLKIIFKILKFNKGNFSLLILNILNITDCWRNDKIFNNFLKINKIMKYLPIKNKSIFIFLDKYLLKIFLLLSNIKGRDIIKLGITGKGIKKKLNFLRLSYLNNNFFFK